MVVIIVKEELPHWNKREAILRARSHPAEAVTCENLNYVKLKKKKPKLITTQKELLP